LDQLTDTVPQLRVIAIDGAAPAEIAVYCNDTLILGDALINFEPYGFALLPPKYCSDPRQMRASLRQLVKLKPQRILFAHGNPIVNKASMRLTELVNADC
jgi:glyoxylase-like metal-dependent hydrolase (beta-lactamase superfamily II)